MGYAKCFDNDAVGKEYKKVCWKKWYAGDADGADCDPEVHKEEPGPDMSPDAENDRMLELQRQRVDTEQDHFYEDG